MFWQFEDKVINISAVDVFELDTNEFYPTLCFGGKDAVIHEIKKTYKYLRPSYDTDKDYNADMYKWYAKFILKAFLVGRDSSESVCDYEKNLSLKALANIITMDGQLFNRVERAVKKFVEDGVEIDSIKIFSEVGKPFSIHLFTITLTREGNVLKISVMDELTDTFYLNCHEVCNIKDDTVLHAADKIVSCFLYKVREHTFLNVTEKDMVRV